MDDARPRPTRPHQTLRDFENLEAAISAITLRELYELAVPQAKADALVE